MKTLQAFEQVIGRKMKYAAQVNTVRNVAKRYNEDPDTSHNKEVARGFETAWANGPAAVLSGDKNEGAKIAASIAHNRDTATVLEHGEIVQIEGESFRVHIHGDGITPAIAFMRIKGA